jgi:hypothetical protein
MKPMKFGGLEFYPNRRELLVAAVGVAALISEASVLKGSRRRQGAPLRVLAPHLGLHLLIGQSMTHGRIIGFSSALTVPVTLTPRQKKHRVPGGLHEECC